MTDNDSINNSLIPRVTWDPVSMTDKILKMMSDGCLKCEVAAELNISSTTLIRWRKMYPELDELLKLGETKSMAWWASKARKNLNSRDFNHLLWYKVMCNAYGYGDRPSERTLEMDEWKGGVYEKIKAIDDMISSGKLSAEHYGHLMRSLDYHTKINEIMYVAPLVTKIEIQRKYDAGEISKVVYDQEMFMLEQNQIMREIAAENIMKEQKVPTKFNVRQKFDKKIKPKKVKNNETLENTYLQEKKEDDFLTQVKKRKAKKTKEEKAKERQERKTYKVSDNLKTPQIMPKEEEILEEEIYFDE